MFSRCTTRRNRRRACSIDSPSSMRTKAMEWLLMLSVPRRACSTTSGGGNGNQLGVGCILEHARPLSTRRAIDAALRGPGSESATAQPNSGGTCSSRSSRAERQPHPRPRHPTGVVPSELRPSSCQPSARARPSSGTARRPRCWPTWGSREKTCGRPASRSNSEHPRHGPPRGSLDLPYVSGSMTTRAPAIPAKVIRCSSVGARLPLHHPCSDAVDLMP